MKREINKTVSFCDNCGKETDLVYNCMACGKEYCYDCQKNLIVSYNHGVNFSGHGDGAFCNDCDKNVPSHLLKLHTLYRKIKQLRFESEAYYKDFYERSKKTEEEIRKEYEKHENN